MFARWTRRVFALILLALIINPFGVFAQEEVGSGGIGGRPAYPREDNTRSDSIFVHTLSPGQSIRDGVNVINNSDEESTVSVYATDSVVSSGGAFACAQEVDEKTSVGSWIELDASEITLTSVDKGIIDFTITVPEDTEVGEHNGPPMAGP